MINKKILDNIGIVGFGSYVPVWRLSTGKIAQVWGEENQQLTDSLGIKSKSVASFDEDSVTMAYEATVRAIQMAKIDPKKLGAIFIGSESHPYSVKPSGVIVAQALGMDNHYFCSNLEFACKAGTTGLQLVSGLLAGGLIDYGLVIASDKAQGRPGDALEYSAGAGAAAFVLGRKKSKIKIKIKAFSSFCSDTPDFWRREGARYPSHSGRFTGEPGYFYHIKQASQNFLKIFKVKPDDFDFAVFHLPNLRFPLKIAKTLGFTEKQLSPSLNLVRTIGNTYSACPLLGLVATLKQAKTKQQIFLASYGSGAGSDVFWLETSKNFKNKSEILAGDTADIDYPAYLRFQGVI